MKEPRTTRIIAWITGVANGKRLGVAALVFAPIAVWLFGVVIPATERACGAAPLDMRPHYGAAEVTAFLSNCGTAGVNAYRTLQVVDLVYPAVSTIVLFIAIGIVMRRLAGPTSPALLLALLPVVSGVADYIENAVAWMYLTDSPSTAWGDIMGMAGTAKTVLGWTGGVVLLGGLVAIGFGSVVRRFHGSAVPE